MSQTTGSAPTAVQVGGVVRVADQPARAMAAVGEQPQQPEPDLPCPPATTTSMATILGPLRPAARPGDAERLEQVQPHLAARGERGHRVEEPVERHLADDGDRRRLKELGHLRAR